MKDGETWAAPFREVEMRKYSGRVAERSEELFRWQMRLRASVVVCFSTCFLLGAGLIVSACNAKGSPECSTAGDCDDGLECTIDFCSFDGCMNVATSNGAPCNGGGGSCRDATCVSCSFGCAVSESLDVDDCAYGSDGVVCNEPMSWFIMREGEEEQLVERSQVPNRRLIMLVKRDSEGNATRQHLVFDSVELRSTGSTLRDFDAATDRLSVLLAMIQPRMPNAMTIHESVRSTEVGIIVEETLDPLAGSVQYVFENTSARFAAVYFEEADRRVFVPPRAGLVPDINWSELLSSTGADWFVGPLEPSRYEMEESACFEHDEAHFIGSWVRPALAYSLPITLGPILAFIDNVSFEDFRAQWAADPESAAFVTVIDFLDILHHVITSVAGLVPLSCVKSFLVSGLDSLYDVTFDLMMSLANAEGDLEFGPFIETFLESFAFTGVACVVEALGGGTITLIYNIVMTLYELEDLILGSFETAFLDIYESMSLPLSSAACPECPCSVISDCCDGCNYKPATWSCFVEESYQCTQGGCGGELQRRQRDQFCSSHSVDCDGHLSGWSNWTTVQTCAADEACNPVTGQCVPGSCPVCGDGNCDGGETECNCSTDCQATCGDGCCSPGETPTSCASDCVCAPLEMRCDGDSVQTCWQNQWIVTDTCGVDEHCIAPPNVLPYCELVTAQSICGNNVREAGELCDGIDKGPYMICAGNCQDWTCLNGWTKSQNVVACWNNPNSCCESAATCGNGVREAEEECDDGNAADTDYCLSTCDMNRCGDGILRIGLEACDDGSLNGDYEYCSSACTGIGFHCGDGLCTHTEDASSCVGDCDAVCGDGICTHAETALSCVGDCDAICSDGWCTHSETAGSCQVDCPASCPDGACTHIENASSCPADCSSFCGDGACTHSETAGSCQVDCAASCPDGFCTHGEGPISCAADCFAICGDNNCTHTENADGCPGDCPPVCGDLYCTHLETVNSCPGDCPKVCGDGFCTHDEDVASCLGDCEFCGDSLCTPGENAGNCEQDCPETCNDTFCTHTEDASGCPADCPGSCGDTLCTHTEDAQNCPGDCSKVCPDGFCTHDESVLSCPDDCDPNCGDTYCTHNEDAGSCENDCAAVCPDTHCTHTENADSCPADCGPSCPDTFCTHTETAEGCPADCPENCGDGFCTHTEDSFSCAGDCPPICGNSVVEPAEICDDGPSNGTFGYCATDCLGGTPWSLDTVAALSNGSENVVRWSRTSDFLCAGNNASNVRCWQRLGPNNYSPRFDAVNDSGRESKDISFKDATLQAVATAHAGKVMTFDANGDASSAVRGDLGGQGRACWNDLFVHYFETGGTWYKYDAGLVLYDSHTYSETDPPSSCETIVPQNRVLLGYDNQRRMITMSVSGNLVESEFLSTVCNNPQDITDVAVSPNYQKTAAVIRQSNVACHQLVVLSSGLSIQASVNVQASGAHTDPTALTAVEFLDDAGTIVATGDSLGVVAIWRVTGNTLVFVDRYPNHGAIRRMSYNPTARLLAVGETGVTVYQLP